MENYRNFLGRGLTRSAIENFMNYQAQRLWSLFDTSNLWKIRDPLCLKLREIFEGTSCENLAKLRKGIIIKLGLSGERLHFHVNILIFLFILPFIVAVSIRMLA